MKPSSLQLASSLLEDSSDESPQETYNRIKASILADAYRSWTPSERVQHWVSKFKIPTPEEEEPNEHVRFAAADIIPSARITRMPSPEEEPYVPIRQVIARKIPRTRIHRRLSAREEPDFFVRKIVRNRLTIRV